MLPENTSTSVRNIRPPQVLRPSVASSAIIKEAGESLQTHRKVSSSIIDTAYPQHASWQPAGIIYSRAEMRKMLLRPGTSPP